MDNENYNHGQRLQLVESLESLEFPMVSIGTFHLELVDFRQALTDVFPWPLARQQQQSNVGMDLYDMFQFDINVYVTMYFFF